MRRWKREHETRLQHKHEAEERCSHCGEVLTAEKRGTIPQSVAMLGTTCVVLEADRDICERCYLIQRGN